VFSYRFVSDCIAEIEMPSFLTCPSNKNRQTSPIVDMIFDVFRGMVVQ